ncbi:MAG: XRE family transcriptional regulator [Nitrospiria bacterium]
MIKKYDKSIGLRIRAIRKHLGLNQTVFGELFGVTQEAVSAWEHGAYPDGWSLLEIAKRGNTDVEWILTGKEHRSVKEAPFEGVDEIAGDPSDRIDQRYALCPLLYDHVTSGPPKVIHDEDIAESLWVPSIIGGKEVYLIRAREDSMGPIFRKDDIVAIREWPTNVDALKGLIVAVWLPEGGLITRWLSADQACWILYPENRRHAPISIEKEKDIRLFRVIWWWGNQR